MLEYCKTVLEKVSFDQKLVERELAKSFRWLNDSEKKEFQQWYSSKFSKQPPEFMQSSNQN